MMSRIVQMPARAIRSDSAAASLVAESRRITTLVLSPDQSITAPKSGRHTPFSGSS
jgi:hypothetical protein